MSEFEKRENVYGAYSLAQDEQYIKDAELAIDDLQAQLAKHRWIPVSERLPEKRQYILVYCPKTEMISEVFANDGIDFANIYTHWKPITLPDKEKSDE